jgi:hypothetical protein
LSSRSIGAAAEAVDLCSPAEAHGLLPRLDLAVDRSSIAPKVEKEFLEIADDNSHRFGTFSFEPGSTNHASQPTPIQQNEFRLDFCREIARLDQWTADRQWLPSAVAELHVAISDRYKISKSLVPAWFSRAGHMEFPAWRVIARKAAITHELAHVFFPNGNRFLAEGLAVYLQAEIGGNPAFPNFGRPLHKLVSELLQEIVPEFSSGDPQSLDCLHLAELDKIATPSPLTLKIRQDFYGEEPRGQACIYPIAGSFVQFLIETHGMEKFRALYQQTPLVPLTQSAGTPDRWQDIYGLSLVDLENEWKSLIAGCRPAAGNDDRAGGR